MVLAEEPKRRLVRSGTDPSAKTGARTLLNSCGLREGERVNVCWQSSGRTGRERFPKVGLDRLVGHPKRGEVFQTASYMVWLHVVQQATKRRSVHAQARKKTSVAKQDTTIYNTSKFLPSPT